MERERKPIRPIFRAVGEGGPGISPERSIYIGDRKPEEAVYSLMQYTADELSVITPDGLEELLAVLDPSAVNWINVNGLGNQDELKRMCRFFGIEPLTREDMLNTEHRPKIEDFGRYLLVITKMLTPNRRGGIEYEQVSFILTANTVITFQETPGDCFEPVRERLRSGLGRLRRSGSAWLFYALLDVIVDTYFIVLEETGAQLESLEDMSMAANPPKDFMQHIQRIKSELNHMRRILWPVRDVTNALMHSESELLDEDQTPFLRDLFENSVQVLEALENYRETASGVQEIYLASISNRMNQIMKVLTIMSTIFIPLTFIAGVYGMNFEYMPELAQPWAYPATLGFMAGLAGAMLFVFKKKRWI
jgi:magnesium transporter